MFSVIIPLYNKEQYICNTIKSVLAQTFQNFEIVIVNDGSTDNSIEKLNSFDDKRIRIIEQTNAGVSAARNKGIKEAKYDLIAFLDADDEWKCDYLSIQYDLIKSFPKCDIFATAYLVNRKQKLTLSKIADLTFDDKGIIDYFCLAYQSDPPVWSSAVVITKKAISAVGGFPLGVRSGEDLITWAKLATLYKIAYATKASSIYNVDEEIWEKGRLPDAHDDVGIELTKLLSETDNDICLRKYIAYWYRIRASMYIKHARHKDTIKEVIKAVRYSPYCLKNYQYLSFSLLPYNLLKLLLKFKKRYS